jgi:uncharacterized protein
MLSRIILVTFFMGFQLAGSAQLKTYEDSLGFFIKKYVAEHEVVTGKKRQYLRFFPVDESYRVVCRFERTENSPWFKMATSGPIQKNYRVFGTAQFSLRDTTVTLNIYQSQGLMNSAEYADYLFVPFTDPTCGHESYQGGRYLDIRISDIEDGRLVLDFNKAYNPYCAYSSGYSCPIPPKENHFPVCIRAGEMAYGKPH